MNEEPNLPVSNEQENQDRELKELVRHVIWYSLLFMFLSLTFLFFACDKYYIEVPEGFAHELVKVAAHMTWIGIAFIFLKQLTKNRGRPTFQSKPRKKGMIFVYFSIIFCILVIYQSLGLFIKASNAKKALNKMVSIYNDANAGKEILSPEKNGKEQYGELTPLMNIMTEEASTIQKDISAMNCEVQECKLESIFKAETLTQPQLRSEALLNYEKAINVLDKYEKQIKLRFDECLIKIRNSSLPENLKSSALLSTEKENNRAFKNILELFEIRRKFIAEAKNLLVYINKSPNSFKYQNNKMIVENVEDANFGSTSTKKLMSLLQEENDWLKKNQEDTSMKLRQVNELVK